MDSDVDLERQDIKRMQGRGTLASLLARWRELRDNRTMRNLEKE